MNELFIELHQIVRKKSCHWVYITTLQGYNRRSKLLRADNMISIIMGEKLNDLMT